MTAPQPPIIDLAVDRKPRDDEIDAFGLTHQGLVREINQDNFLIAGMRKQMQVVLTSLPNPDKLTGNERLALFAMVADGVGGGPRGEVASRFAAEAITEYVAQSVKCYYAADLSDELAFLRALEEGALHCHVDLTRRALDDPDLDGMATTLTLWIGVWPRAYLLQVGDSRCYVLRDGELTQISRDQTLAQELIDQGVFTRADAQHSKLANILASAIGGPQAAPIVTRLEQRWGDIGLLCSDGLTKHVPDERIRERLLAMTSARHACEALLADALDAGGTDNITIVVGRTIRRD
ncbi:MAG TPA: protein phosphatase 2C domain-containing protein [Gemmatimonadales bacterium]|nr:protein phosphatase 2C domain-containing protein [Gemmatimonadales bacterium]